MSLIGRLMMEAARRAAANPEVREKAARVAEEAYRVAKPKVENVGRHIAESFRETKGEANLSDDPIGFAKRFKNRLLPPEEK